MSAGKPMVGRSHRFDPHKAPSCPVCGGITMRHDLTTRKCAKGHYSTMDVDDSAVLCVRWKSRAI